jgi:replication factor A1
MGAIEDVYGDLDTDVELEEFREAVEAKVEQMGGLADEETAAMLVAHELEDGEVEGVADVEAGMEEVKFLAKVVSVGDLRTFERDGEDEDEGRVLNADVADETGSVRVAFWNETAVSASEELSEGDVLRIAGRPKEGYNGVEVNVDKVEPEPDVEVDVATGGAHRIEDLAMGLSDVTVQGVVLETEAIRTFDRDDGSEGRVANLLLGDETGRVRVTLWDGQADRAEELDAGATVEVVDGYVRERDGALELHVGERGAVDEVETDVTFEPEAASIDGLEIGTTEDVAGVVRSVDEKRTFERDDGSEGQVRNVRVQDDTGDIRVALWGDKADLDVGPGDQVLCIDVEIQDGWQDDLEASAGWQSSVVTLDDDAAAASRADAAPADEGESDGATGLSAFEDGDGPDAAGESETADAAAGPDDGEETTFTGVVVQAGDPVILDDGEETVSVVTGADVTLGEEVTVRGSYADGRIDADEVC